MTRRPVAVLLLATIAALVWAPLTVFAASPTPSVSLLVAPEPSAGAVLPAPTATPTAAAPSVATVATPAATATPTTHGDATLVAPSGPVARAVASPPGADTSPASPAPRAAASPAAPRSSPAAADASSTPSAAATPVRDGLSETMLLTVIGVAVIAILGVFFMILGVRRPHAEGPEDPKAVLSRAAEAAMTARTLRRARISPADDPILRAMGLGPEVPPPSRGGGSRPRDGAPAPVKPEDQGAPRADR